MGRPSNGLSNFYSHYDSGVCMKNYVGQEVSVRIDCWSNLFINFSMSFIHLPLFPQWLTIVPIKTQIETSLESEMTYIRKKMNLLKRSENFNGFFDGILKKIFKRKWKEEGKWQ